MRTIAALWEAAVAERRGYPAFLTHEAGTWRPVSWEEAGLAVDELAAGLVAQGVERGDAVALIARTRLEWVLVDYALAAIGAVSVPVYPTASATEAAYILARCGTRLAVCEDAEGYAKLAPLRTELPALTTIVAMEGAPGSAMPIAELRERGRALLERRPDAVAERRSAVSGDDVLTIIHTSGTTGPPKGCVITHENYRSMVEMVGSVPGLFEDADRVLLYLPLAHNFARLVQFAGTGVGFTIALCPDVAEVPQAILDVRPTILPSVPRLFEKVQLAVETSLGEATGLRAALGSWAVRVGRRTSELERAGRRVGPGLAARRAVADRLVFSKVKARLGGELRVAISGGAPLPLHVAEFFHALGVLVLEGYGLTECTTASHVNHPRRFRFGTVGLPLDRVEARVADDGELQLRGPNVFAGYWQDEAATREALTADGWLRTGDIGSIDAEGFLTITDRRKDLIVTAGGKNVSPQNIEAALVASPYVSQALVVGDRRPYLVALVVPDGEQLARVGAAPDQSRALIERAIADVNRELGRVEQIKRFAILDRELTIEAGEVTPTLKLRRSVVAEHFRDEVEALYADAPAED